MAIHELCTNAVKYGALPVDTGAVHLTWTLKEDGAWTEIEWREQGGPFVHKPSHRGFGSSLIERALARQFHGRAQLDFKESEAVCTLSVPLSPP